MNSVVIREANNPIATFIFAHGAGAGKDHTFMVEMTSLLVKRQINVVRFDFPYMEKRAVDGKKYPPNRMPILLEAYKEVVRKFAKEEDLFIGGKSMGSRVAMTLLAESDKTTDMVKGAICLGYPFHPAKKTDKLRLEPLQANHVNTLICQGDRDPLGDQTEVLSYGLPKHYHIEFLPDGDHDFKPRVKSGYTHDNNKVKVADQIVDFITRQIEKN